MLCFLSLAAHAQTNDAPRLALVIGNVAYSGAGELKNPVNDATDMAAKLKTLRFDVTHK